MPDSRAGRTLWLATGPRAVEGDDVAIVVDLTWTPGPADRARGVRSIHESAARVLARFDPIEETSRLLDDWAVAAGVVESMTVGRTSFWFRVRLAHWLWLQEHVVWAALLHDLIDELAPAAIGCDQGLDESLMRVARLTAQAAGLPLHTTSARLGWTRESLRRGWSKAFRIGRGATARTLAPARRLVSRRGPGASAGRVLARLADQSERPLLGVLTQLPHRVETQAGSRVMNPYLGPILDRLVGSRLDPIVVDRYVSRTAGGPPSTRVLPFEVLRLLDDGPSRADRARAAEAARTIAAAGVPAMTSGIDLGPFLGRRVAEDARRTLIEAPVAVRRWRALGERVRARAFLVADEYHRQDCLEAASQLGIPVAAVQHGTIYRHHNGYVHRARPSALRLPDRTYVFGRWERDLLVGESVYRDTEVVVGGSPRQDLYQAARVDREAARAELGVRAGERLIVLSGTYGAMYRRLYYPLLLSRLFDRPMPGVRLVVKQHPAETDEGPYRGVLDGVAAAAGFAPPPMTIVRDVDLYRVLAAADAHLGIHSTVLTEAVFVGTPNLLATGVLGGDLLDYVAAGVALPVADGAGVLAALDAAAAGAITEAARAAFIAAHFEPGSASQRIADDLLGWLA